MMRVAIVGGLVTGFFTLAAAALTWLLTNGSRRTRLLSRIERQVGVLKELPEDHSARATLEQSLMHDVATLRRRGKPKPTPAGRPQTLAERFDVNWAPLLTGVVSFAMAIVTGLLFLLGLTNPALARAGDIQRTTAAAFLDDHWFGEAPLRPAETLRTWATDSFQESPGRDQRSFISYFETVRSINGITVASTDRRNVFLVAWTVLYKNGRSETVTSFITLECSGWRSVVPTLDCRKDDIRIHDVASVDNG